MKDLDRFSALRIATPADVRPAALALKRLVETLGDWRVAATHNIATKRPMCDAGGQILATSVFDWADTRSERWWCANRLAFNSPLPTACRFESEPFWANAQGFHTLTPNPLVQEIDIGDFERRSMTHAAIIVPVHTPLGVIGAASIIPRDRWRTDLSDDFEEFGDMLGVACRKFISSYNRLIMPLARMPSGHDLSNREVECLRWAAVGKTDLEIGMIMARSRATVRFHMHNAVTKLDAVNRSQAVFKATQLGHLSFRH